MSLGAAALPAPSTLTHCCSSSFDIELSPLGMLLSFCFFVFFFSPLIILQVAGECQRFDTQFLLKPHGSLLFPSVNYSSVGLLNEVLLNVEIFQLMSCDEHFLVWTFIIKGFFKNRNGKTLRWSSSCCFVQKHINATLAIKVRAHSLVCIDF